MDDIRRINTEVFGISELTTVGSPYYVYIPITVKLLRENSVFMDFVKKQAAVYETLKFYGKDGQELTFKFEEFDTTDTLRGDKEKPDVKYLWLLFTCIKG
jgi:hypothetical protein